MRAAEEGLQNLLSYIPESRLPRALPVLPLQGLQAWPRLLALPLPSAP